MRLIQQLGRDNTECSAVTSGGKCNRVLVATGEELDIIQTALSLYRTMLHEKARTECTVYSEDAIRICVRKMCVENLLEAIEPRTVYSRNSGTVKTVPSTQTVVPRRAAA